MSWGRKTLDGATVRRVQVMLDEDTIERAKALGQGNVSQGIRKAVKEATMGKYIIHELQNLESTRKGEIYEGTLQGAKAKATRDQMWQGTVLKITDEEGRTVAVKDKNAGTGKTLDLVPWNERGSLSERQAAVIAAEASEITGFQVQGYRVETATASRLIKIEGSES